MEKFQVTEKYEGIKAERVFEVGKLTFSDLGMKIIKDRSFAFLLQGSLSVGENLINANFIVSAFQNEINLTLTSETADKEVLSDSAKRFMETLKSRLVEL